MSKFKFYLEIITCLFTLHGYDIFKKNISQNIKTSMDGKSDYLAEL